MPVPYIEGWWVAPDLRRSGVGRALIEAIEQWCRENGYPELGSDVELDNATSLAAHARSQPRHLAPQPKAQSFSPRGGLDGVVDSLLFAQHAVEMFRR